MEKPLGPVVPDNTLVISATDTGVGKTWLTVELALGLQARGVPVAIRKPVQSFDPGDRTTDADLLAEASGENPLVVCPGHRRYPLAMAPPMAADALDAPPIKLAELIDELELPTAGVALIEGVGGPRSPLSHDGDTVALARAVDAERVMLVANPGLGTINATLLSASAFDGMDVTVFLNYFDKANPLHAANRQWLAARAHLEVVTDPADLIARMTATKHA
ncbi:MAG: ATP-dependent dethiobiotin synthetase BioD [Actinomycetota bacterium]